MPYGIFIQGQRTSRDGGLNLDLGPVPYAIFGYECQGKSWDGGLADLGFPVIGVGAVWEF